VEQFLSSLVSFLIGDFNMWGYGNSAILKPITTYAGAKERFTNTVPIRGRAKECRPLGKNRRYTGYTIAKNMRVVEDGYVGQWLPTYSAQVYGKDVVEWYPDGTLALRIGRWHGTVVQSVVNYTLTSGVGTIQSYNGKWYFHSGNGNAYFIPQNKDQVLLINTENSAVENPIQEYRRRVKRKAMNEVRKRYSSFIEYGGSMLKITQDAFKYIEEEVTEVMGSSDRHQLAWSRWADVKEVATSRSKFLKKVEEFELSGNLNLAYNLVSVMIKSINYWAHSCTSEQFKKSFDEVLKYQFKDEVFESEPVEIGKAFYDRNAKYFY
jgi:hypothetical protein